MNTIIRKKLLMIATILMIMIVIISFLPMQSQLVFADSNEDTNNTVNKTENVSDFIKDWQTVSGETILTDFANNQFKLYELSPTGYAIYSLKDTASIFIEGSYSYSSPYTQYSNDKKYYIGPGEYYVETEYGIENILTKEIKNDIPNSSYTIAPIYYQEQSKTRASFPSTPDSNKTHIDSNGFTVINNDDYFRELTKFPDNTVGTCGLVGICILLGYFDTFVDSNFITDASFKNGNGTTQTMHDYLFNNCMHTVLGLGSDDEGYPMAGYELRETMKDYLNNKCSSSLRNRITHEYGSLFYTHANPKKHINGGYPTLLSLTAYNQSSLSRNSDKDKYHVVAAYGYDGNDRFLVHMGWWPGYTDFTEIVISNATIHSYYTLNYT